MAVRFSQRAAIALTLFTVAAAALPCRAKDDVVTPNRKIEAFDLPQVRLLPSPFKNAQDKNAADAGNNSKEEKNTGGYDEMLPQAVEVVLETKSCSVSMLQRRVKLGYSRAARIVDQMEELGIVGPYEGAKPRQVVIDRSGWHEIQVQLGLIQEDDLALAAEMNAADEFNSDSDE